MDYWPESWTDFQRWWVFFWGQGCFTVGSSHVQLLCSYVNALFLCFWEGKPQNQYMKKHKKDTHPKTIEICLTNASSTCVSLRPYDMVILLFPSQGTFQELPRSSSISPHSKKFPTHDFQIISWVLRFPKMLSILMCLENFAELDFPRTLYFRTRFLLIC